MPWALSQLRGFLRTVTEIGCICFAVMLLCGAPQVFADEGIYVCTEISEGGACTTFAEITGGSATFGDVGLTTSSIVMAIGVGLALVLGMFAIGFALGALRKLLDGIFGGQL